MSNATNDADELSELVYDQLRAIARVCMAGERPGHLSNTTSLVNEAMLKLTRDGRITLENRPEFFRAAAASMRQVLIDHARSARRLKRGGGQTVYRSVEMLYATGDAANVDLDRLLVIDETLARMEAVDARAAEVVRLRLFAGLSMPEVAETIGVSLRAAERLWTYARAWLWRELGPDVTG